jgi:hypothetical protein
VVSTTQARNPRELYVPIETVRMNAKKLRKLSAAKIRRYAADFEAGAAFPAISVTDCGGFYTIRDGRHRYQAQLANGYQFILVDSR